MTTSLLIFAKAPEPGLSKTRLTPLLDAEEAAAVHEQLSRRVFQAIATSQLSIVLWGASQHPTLVAWAAQSGWPLRQQQGDDLGERMAHALADELAAGAERAILIGTDCPLMSANYVAQAEAALASADVVLGPAEDGGYVLIGCSRAVPEIFREIEWGTNRVLEQTLKSASQAQLRVSQLDTLWDVDRPEDWLRYLALQAAEKEKTTDGV